MAASAHRHRLRRRRDQRGAAVVEFALVLPLLLTLVIGGITAGMAYYQKITLADAVREGARFGATADTATIGDWAGAVKQRTVAAAAGELELADVCASGPAGGSCGSGPSTPLSSGPGVCVVHVQATLTDVPIWVGIDMIHVDIVQDSYARYERTC